MMHIEKPHRNKREENKHTKEGKEIPEVFPGGFGEASCGMSPTTKYGRAHLRSGGLGGRGEGRGVTSRGGGAARS